MAIPLVEDPAGGVHYNRSDLWNGSEADGYSAASVDKLLQYCMPVIQIILVVLNITDQSVKLKLINGINNILLKINYHHHNIQKLI